MSLGLSLTSASDASYNLIINGYGVYRNGGVVMNEGTFQGALQALIESWDQRIEDSAGDPEIVPTVQRVETFCNAGLLTVVTSSIASSPECRIRPGNHGLVVTLNDGSEFQIAIVQSRDGREEA
jgi:hypothetical protein